ncbi:MAG: hypothetical protein CMO38_08635 [Verrucomicrobiaceae bacterium]|nr:hypothetical protein [Verrucomicrobiaceae bacterium]
MDFNSRVLNIAKNNLDNETSNASFLLNDTLRLLAKWRMELIRNTFLQHGNTIVASGPLAGLDFLEMSAEGCHIPKLIGCYEQPLSPYIKAAIDTKYSTVIHIGCAEGYYAVGMTKKMPATKSFAFDINDKAQNICRDLARKNNVEDRIKIDGNFKIEEFSNFNQGNILVFCDIEGGEYELLDPNKAPNLRQMDIIVELHNIVATNGLDLLINRFKDSHTVTVVEDDGQRDLKGVVAPWFKSLSHLDQLITVWEMRSEPTPWLVMKVKKL